MARLVPLVLCAAVLAPRAANAEPRVSDVDRQIAAAAERLEALVEQHNAARSDLAATRARAAATSQRIAELARGLDGARDRVSAVAVWAYRRGPTAEIGAVLAAGSPDTFVFRLTSIQELARSEQRDIHEFTERTRTLAEEYASLRKLEDEKARQEAELGGLAAQVEKDIAALKVLRNQIGTTSRHARTTLDARAASAATPPPASGAGGRAVAFAYAQMGKPYQWGADGPGSYDCSGLTTAAWQTAGISLPHNAARQYSAVAHISRGQLQPGDLVFYFSNIAHVAMYVGDGNVIHAPNTGDHVRVERIDNAPVKGYGRPS
ncbi:MAG: peptidoglycan DL-endopeptidase CwlO [Micromonosporaceae bacterium]|jgi:cell wall-associated NlpC family hydrolase|nr:peptidoglycan DL-endopeptidase CwlO [Micromonosporaceae bacterium]